MTPHTSRLTTQREERKALVLELHGQGLEPGQIAGRVGLSEMTVRHVLADAKLVVPATGKGRTPRKGKKS